MVEDTVTAQRLGFSAGASWFEKANVEDGPLARLGKEELREIKEEDYERLTGWFCEFAPALYDDAIRCERPKVYCLGFVRGFQSSEDQSMKVET